MRYFYVSLVTMHRGKLQPVRFSVHRLVCSAWHGLPRPGQECRHLSHKRDNRPAKLRWGTKGQNEYDKVRKKKTVKLSHKAVKEARLLIMSGLGYSDVAKLCGVSYHSIYYIAEGVTWRSRAAIPVGFRDWQREHLMRGTGGNAPSSAVASLMAGDTMEL